MKNNIKSFKALIERYRSITREDVIKVYKKSFNSTSIANELTGFGDAKTCTLCIEATKIACNEINIGGIYGGVKCNFCIYGKEYYCCQSRESRQTYDAITYAESTAELLEAFRNRADYMESLIGDEDNG